MTFTDDLPATILLDGPGLGASLRHVEADAAAVIPVESAGLLFRGDYVRDGGDLVVSGAGEGLVVHGYFTAAHRPALVAPNGARLSDAVIEALARPAHGVQIAQAGDAPAPETGPAIGRVQTTTGTASVVRNGVSVTLHAGDLVYKGDVVQTGAASTLAIAFLDGTLFSLAGDARMVLSDMVYKADAADNHSLFNLVQGTINFVAGKVAKTGDMKVGTPVATMGIRGTFVGAEIDANDGTSRLSVKTEPPTPDHPDGYTGRFNVYDPNDPGHLLFTVTDPTTAYVVHPDGSGGVRFETVQKTPDELAREAQLTQEIFRTLAQTPRLPVFNGPAQGGGVGSGVEPSQILPNPALPSPPGFGPTSPLDGGPNPGGPVQPGPQPLPQQDRPDGTAPFLTDLRETPAATTLDLPSRTASVVQDSVKTGLGDQSLLATAGSGARIVAAHAGTSAAIDLIDGAVSLDGRYGTLTLRADGSYSYRADHAAALAEGQHGTDVFSVTVQRGSETGATTLTVDVTGLNNAPVLATAAPLSLRQHSGPTQNGTLEQAAGRVSFTDPDLTDTHSATVVGSPTITRSHDAALPIGLAASLATALTVQVDQSSHTVGYRFAAPDKTFDFLAAGETLSLTYDLSLSDGHGGTAHTPVTVTITGSNDAPVVSGPVTGTAMQGGPATRLDALANASDVDDGAQLSVVGLPGPLPTGVTYDATSHSFVLDPADPTFRHLAAGQSTTVTVAYGVSDGLVTTPASLFWTVTGINDAPTVDAPLASAAQEGGPAFVLDLLTGAHDVDDGDRLSITDIAFVVDDGASSGTPPAGLSLSGSSLTVDPGNAAFDHLAAGQTETILVQYTIADGHGGTVEQDATITVTGINDAPVLAAAPGLSLTEQPGVTGSLDLDTATGRVRFGDPDLTDTHSAAIVGSPTITRSHDATLPIGLAASLATALTVQVDQSSHTVGYRFAAPDKTFDFLAAGETLSLTYDLSLSDGHGGTAHTPVTVTVTGSNDAPVLDGGGDIHVGSGESVAVTSAILHATDPDTPPDQLTYTIIPDEGANGTFTRGTGSGPITTFTQADIDAGSIVYHRDASPAGHLSDTVSFTVSDGTDSQSGSLSITLPSGPSAQPDRVVLASDDDADTVAIPTEALLFNDTGTPPLSVNDVQRGGTGNVALSGTTVSFTPFDGQYNNCN